MRKILLFPIRSGIGFGVIAGLAALGAGVPIMPVQAQQAGQTVPKAGEVTPSPDARPGETLTRQLDRNKGVIQPPSTDPGMTVPVPPAGGNSMPVIPPPSGPDVEPK